MVLCINKQNNATVNAYEDQMKESANHHPSVPVSWSSVYNLVSFIPRSV